MLAELNRGRRVWDAQHTQSRDETDAEASKEAACKEHGDGGSDGLKDDAEVEDPGGDHEGQAAANVIGKEGRGEGAEEGAGGENGDDAGLLAGCDVGVALGVGVAGAEESLPVGHGEDAADGARVIAVKGVSGRVLEGMCERVWEDVTRRGHRRRRRRSRWRWRAMICLPPLSAWTGKLCGACPSLSVSFVVCEEPSLLDGH